jgi:hypothetical protein
MWLLRRHREIIPVWPTDSVNSYELLEMADRVFVYGSTVGLEASANSKSVWNSMNSVYDEYADVRKFEPGKTYDSSFFEIWDVEKSKSLDIIETMIESDRQFSQGITSPAWNPSTIPIVVRLYNLLRVGSAAYILLIAERYASLFANKFVISVLRKIYGSRKKL